MDTISATCSDAFLIEEARKGNEHAFAILIDRYRSLAFGTAWVALQDYDDTEDATQESFVRAYRHLDDLKDPARFSAWIYSIALAGCRHQPGRSERSAKTQRGQLPHRRGTGIRCPDRSPGEVPDVLCRRQTDQPGHGFLVPFRADRVERVGIQNRLSGSASPVDALREKLHQG